MTGIGESIGEGVQARKQLKASKDEVKRQKDDRERALWMVDEQDWKPELASEHIGPYQRSQAPEADAFMSSLLSGNNASAIQSTRAGAPRLQAEAQQRFDTTTGGWDKLRQQQADYQKTTPWDVKPFDPITKTDVSEEAYNAGRLPYLSREQADALSQAGFGFKDGRFREKFSDKESRDLMRSLGLDTDSKGGEGQRVLAGIADQLAQGRSLKDIRAEMDGPKKIGEWLGEVNRTQIVPEEQRKIDFMNQFGARRPQPTPAGEVKIGDWLQNPRRGA